MRTPGASSISSATGPPPLPPSNRPPRPRPRPHARGASTTSGASRVQDRVASPFSGASRLQDPARLGSSASISVAVTDPGGPAALSVYLSLPPEQYSALDPGLIRPLGGNRFQLRVPRVTLLSQWLEPTVDIVVAPAGRAGAGAGGGPRVLLRSAGCRLRGSELVERMRLDQRMELRFETELTWTSGGDGGGGGGGSDSSAGGAPARINGDLQLEVLTEVIAPFHLLPRSVLEGAGNAALRGLVASLFPIFLHRLAADYERWAGDEEYRRSRATRRY